MPTWDELQEGSAPEAQEYGPISRTDMVRYQGASGDFNPIHHDEEFAKSAGLPVGVLGRHAAGRHPRRLRHRLARCRRTCAGTRCSSGSRCGRATSSCARAPSPASTRTTASARSTSTCSARGQARRRGDQGRGDVRRPVSERWVMRAQQLSAAAPDRDPTARCRRTSRSRTGVARGARARARVRVLSHRPPRRRGRARAAALPVVPGHQVVGASTPLGDGMHAPRGRRSRRRAWLHRTCGVCAFCVRGEENLCVAAEFTGWTVDGGYADAGRRARGLRGPAPGALDDFAAAPLLCAGVIGYRALCAGPR